MKKHTKHLFLFLTLLLISHLPALGIAGGGSLILINETNYNIYLRQVPIVAIWAYLMDLTDPVEFSPSDPLGANFTSQPASWTIFSVGNKTSNNLLPSLFCRLGFITKDGCKEFDINLQEYTECKTFAVDNCTFTIKADLLEYNYTWPLPSKCYHCYQTVLVTVSQNDTCEWAR